MKETKIKICPAFSRQPINVDSSGNTTMVLVGALPKGGRAVLTLTDMPAYMVKRLVKDGLRALQIRRDRALQDVEEMRFQSQQ